MHGLSELVLGLGLFFLGIQLVGEHLRRLSSGSFRRVLGRVSARPWLAGLTGLGFGALMQSATAVTFIVAGMVRSGLVTMAGAAPVILWANVGLTALAFLATFDIHPYVAYLVGVAGVFFGLERRPTWRAAAGVLLGVALVLFGLESMGAGASPLRQAAWFQDLLAATVDSPFVAFGVGVLAAAILQSNTGAALLIITLFGGGSFQIEQAAMLLYGTNLGAIALRFFLALRFDPPSKRLVRFEDLFCLWSGVLMVALTFVERAGVPLVQAGVQAVFENPRLELAAIFVLSNLLPAATLAFFIGPVVRRLERWLPGEAEIALARPKFLTDAALDDPATGLDLMARETARLFAAIEVRPAPEEFSEDGDPAGDPAFNELGNTIERFGARLAAREKLTEPQTHRLHLLRAELALVRYFDDAVREFNAGLHEAGADAPAAAGTLRAAINELLAAGRAAFEKPTAEAVERLRALTKRHGDYVKAQTAEARQQSDHPGIAALADAFELAAWMLHRLSKVRAEFAEDASARRKAGM